MRIFQTDFSENAFDGNRLIFIERRSKGVMRPRRYSQSQQYDAREQ
jgi:hypothetical protein